MSELATHFPYPAYCCPSRTWRSSDDPVRSDSYRSTWVHSSSSRVGTCEYDCSYLLLYGVGGVAEWLRAWDCEAESHNSPGFKSYHATGAIARWERRFCVCYVWGLFYVWSVKSELSGILWLKIKMKILTYSPIKFVRKNQNCRLTDWLWQT